MDEVIQITEVDDIPESALEELSDNKGDDEGKEEKN